MSAAWFSLSWMLMAFPQRRRSREERAAARTFHPPPREPRPSPRGAVKPHGCGPPTACAPARRSLHRHTQAGEGRLGALETRPLSRRLSPRPNPIPLWFTLAPRPRIPLTRVGLDVLPQEVAAGKMLEAKVLGDPLAHGAFARAGRPKDDRAQEFGSHCLREEWGSQTRNLDNGLRQAPGTLFLLPLPLTPSSRSGTRWPPLQGKARLWRQPLPSAPQLGGWKAE